MKHGAKESSWAISQPNGQDKTKLIQSIDGSLRASQLRVRRTEFGHIQPVCKQGTMGWPGGYADVRVNKSLHAEACSENSKGHQNGISPNRHEVNSRLVSP